MRLKIGENLGTASFNYKSNDVRIKLYQGKAQRLLNAAFIVIT